MIIKVKTLVFCEFIYEYGDVYVMLIPIIISLPSQTNVTSTEIKAGTRIWLIFQGDSQGDIIIIFISPVIRFCRCLTCLFSFCILL